MTNRSFTVRVPASSANIGPGFDVLGIALNLYLEVKVDIDSSVSYDDPYNAKLTYTGSLAHKVPLQSDKNLVTQCALYILRANGIEKFPQGTFISVSNPVPLSRGLGSSASAICAGIALGNVIGQFNFSKERLLDYCLLIERHPDNIAAAMLGGFVGSYLTDLSPEETEAKNISLDSVLSPSSPISPPPNSIGQYIKYSFNSSIKFIAIIPNFELSTDKSRDILPKTYEKFDIIFNLQRLAVLTTSLGQSPPNPNLIHQAMKDKIHQPYRSTLIPGLTNILESVTPETDPGLCGICLSGAGPTILCLATENFDQIAGKIIGQFKQEGIDCDWKLLDIAHDGVIVEEH